MGLLTEIKCARCDKRYSGLRSRCPFCGARRIGRGKYSGEPDENRGKMIIGILVLVVLIAAVAVLVFTTDTPEAEPEITNSPPPTISVPDESTVETLPGTNTDPIEPPLEETPPEETEPPAPVVNSINITYQGSNKTDITMKTSDAQLPLSAKLTPDGVEEPVEWTSSNPDVFEVVPNDTTGRTAKITSIGAGTATLTASIGDVSAECIIRVNKG